MVHSVSVLQLASWAVLLKRLIRKQRPPSSSSLKPIHISSFFLRLLCLSLRIFLSLIWFKHSLSGTTFDKIDWKALTLSIMQFAAPFSIVQPASRLSLLRVLIPESPIWPSCTLRDGSGHQNGWIFGKSKWPLPPPPPSFSEIYVANYFRHIKVQNPQHKFLDWTWPSPLLEVFRKFIPLDSLTRPSLQKRSKIIKICYYKKIHSLQK